jgi:hypothetical protein
MPIILGKTPKEAYTEVTQPIAALIKFADQCLLCTKENHAHVAIRIWFADLSHDAYRCE